MISLGILVLLGGAISKIPRTLSSLLLPQIKPIFTAFRSQIPQGTLPNLSAVAASTSPRALPYLLKIIFWSVGGRRQTSLLIDLLALAAFV